MPSTQVIELLIVAVGTVAGVHSLWPRKPAASRKPLACQPEEEALIRRLEHLRGQINAAETEFAALLEDNDALALANHELQVDHAQLQTDIERLKADRRALDGFS
ncbi:hypothetical protein AB3X91_34355 [Paraburkholderia sp. BR14263]|uniref:hypothetical protein n=1 Tax=unclassified Paraburkholderia TaxID=2615204 RepID=UPI0034CF6B86